ncbi:glycoside hydrolase family 99-like domain-containing protein [Niveibacterium terrae]|uniref:glycoside hydrolase family 99-like domain-containing protein n=1 Tax=Niveibacterium terrae TaxID=3373598 RepID=UPI003A8FD6F2
MSTAGSASVLFSRLRRAIVGGLVLGGLASSGAALGGQYLIGTYYFPGWTDHAKGLNFPLPWEPIKKYPEREPLLGWYSDSDGRVLRKQIEWMRSYGIGFVAFDWYWNGKASYLDQSVKTFKAVKIKGQMSYSLLWANHFRFPGKMPEYKAMVDDWIANHFSDPDFLKIDGRPVVFVFAMDAFADAAKTIGVSPRELVDVADAMTRAAGFPGIYLVGGTPALEYWVNGVGPSAGFKALSAYNYHRGYSGTAESAKPNAEGYAQFDAAYQQNWKWILQKASLPYIVPMSSGWDSRPWKNGVASKHDDSMSSPDQFESHLLAAKKVMDGYPGKTRKMGVICCWNEFGEGSYIEPTKKDGFSYLEKVRKVFGSGAGK